VLIIPLCEGLF
jgi:hypothetical protein